MELNDLLNMEGDLPVRGITCDSREARKGYLFAALSGDKLDGTKFIGDAIHHGAQIILAQEGTVLPDDVDADEVVLITSPNPRQAFAQLTAKFYKLQPEYLVGVTGTSGKTSTVSFVQQLWHLSGIKNCASLGTLGVRGPGMRRYGSLTTPDTQSLHAELADLAAVGIQHLAMEASSHGLDQYRLDGVSMKAAAFTNLSRDHMDYHADMEAYFKAKARLFTDIIPAEGSAVINIDDSYGERLAKECEARGQEVISFGERDGASIQLLSRALKPNGQDIEISVFGKAYKITLPLVGEFQIFNALCALGLVLSQDKDIEKYTPLLARLRGVAGRLQFIEGHKKGAVYVDYAHKPAALEAILNTLRPHTQGKLVCLFGCGGNRDPGKRQIMGEIATRLADSVIITDDNPRYEEAATIRAEILKGASNALEIGDRAEAIGYAIKNLNQGDVLVVAGKGHEQGQIVEDTVFIFDDAEEVKKALQNQ